MDQEIKQHIKSESTSFETAILIPSWNNLAYLENCINSIHKNSQKQHQIIVFVNEGKDGTLQWLDQKQDIDFLHSKTNLGICTTMNLCRAHVKAKHIIYMNDDMYVLPGWDKYLMESVGQIGNQNFMLSATMIEPMWDTVGGFSEEFSPGMYSDPDLAKKCYEAGTRIFLGLGNSLVYHFGSKSTKKIKQNEGRKTFIRKWGMSAGFFTKQVIRSGQAYGKLPDKYRMSVFDRMVNWVKTMLN